MPLNTIYHKVPPSCVLELNADEREGKTCECEDAKHVEDWVKLKPKLSYGEKIELAERMGQSAASGLCWMLERYIAEWSLLDTSTRLVNGIDDATGAALAISIPAIYDLDEETADYLSQLTEPKKPAGDGEDPKGTPARRSRKR